MQLIFSLGIMTTSFIPRDAILDGCHVAPSSGKDFSSGLRPLLSAAKNDLDSGWGLSSSAVVGGLSSSAVVGGLSSSAVVGGLFSKA